MTLRELAKLLRVASPATATARLEEALDFGAVEQDDSMIATGRGARRYYKVVMSSASIDTNPNAGIFPPEELVENLFLGGGDAEQKNGGQEEKAFKKKEI